MKIYHLTTLVNPSKGKYRKLKLLKIDSNDLLNFILKELFENFQSSNDFNKADAYNKKKQQVNNNRNSNWILIGKAYKKQLKLF